MLTHHTAQVEYFGQNLNGMAFTQHGWVQSYGSRYVRPPLVVSDIEFVAPMTVKEFAVSSTLLSGLKPCIRHVVCNNSL